MPSDVLEVKKHHRKLAAQYRMTVAREDGYWVARVSAPEFRFIIGGGASAEEATGALLESLALEAAAREEEGRAMPEPIEGYSGHLNARLPKSLHQALAHRAAAEGLSVNATLVYLLTGALTPDRAVKPRRRNKTAAA